MASNALPPEHEPEHDGVFAKELCELIMASCLKTYSQEQQGNGGRRHKQKPSLQGLQ